MYDKTEMFRLQYIVSSKVQSCSKVKTLSQNKYEGKKNIKQNKHEWKHHFSGDKLIIKLR